MKNHMWLGFGD